LAIKSVIPEYPQIKMLCIGSGERWYEKELKEYANELGLTRNIMFLGAQNGIERILKMADGKILATRNCGRGEGFGAALVEAMAAGLPVIATKSGGPEDIVIPGKTGWLVHPEGSEPLANALREFCQDSEKRKLYGLNAQSIAKKKFNLKLMNKRYECIYTTYAKHV